MNKSGHLWGIGVGPGEPGLLTLKALKTIKEATVVMAPRASSRDESAALQIVKEWVDEDRLRIYGFPMTREPDSLANCWREVADEVAALVEKGEKVVFLTLGDALTYSTFNYILQQLANKIPPECVTTIPGVTSFAAAAAAQNFPIVCGEELMAVIPLPDGPLTRVRGLVRESDTVVFMKIGDRLEELLEFVNEEFPDREAVFASRVGTLGQYLCRDLNQLQEGVKGYLSVMIVRKAGKKS